MTDTTATHDRVVFDGPSRAAQRALALEYAHGVINAPVGAATLADYRHAVLVLADVLEHDQRARNLAGVARARQALHGVRPLCPGTGEFVPARDTDGDGIATCPACRRFRPTYAVDTVDRWRVVATHTAPHLRECFDRTGALRCVCPLQDSTEPI